MTLLPLQASLSLPSIYLQHGTEYRVKTVKYRLLPCWMKREIFRCSRGIGSVALTHFSPHLLKQPMRFSGLLVLETVKNLWFTRKSIFVNLRWKWNRGTMWLINCDFVFLKAPIQLCISAAKTKWCVAFHLKLSFYEVRNSWKLRPHCHNADFEMKLNSAEERF